MKGSLKMATINFQPQPATVRQIYETAYRNARCVRSLDARATITRIIEIDPVKRQRVTGIISWAIEAAENRREPMMAWFCITYENRFKQRKQELGL